MRHFPNISRLGSQNAFEATLADGTLVLISYRTPVAAFIRGVPPEVLTAAESLSISTTRQISDWLYGRRTRHGRGLALGERLGMSRESWYRLLAERERKVPAAELSARYAHLLPLADLPVRRSSDYHGYPKGTRSAAIPDRLARLGAAH